MKIPALLLVLLILPALTAAAAQLAVETPAGMWPVWNRLEARHPLPPGFRALRIEPGTAWTGDRLLFRVVGVGSGGTGSAADARVVDRIALAPFGRVWDAGRSVSLQDIRAGRVPTAPVESIRLPDIALPVEGSFPDEPGYPLFADVSLRLLGADPALHEWTDAIEEPAVSRAEITWIGAVGDVMPARGVDSLLLAPDGARRVFGDTLPVLSASFLLLGNLEAAATAATVPENKTYRFKFDASALRVLKAAGFSYLSVANNHTFDLGRRGVLDTLDGLAKSGIGTSGAGIDLAAAERPFVTTPNGQEIRVLSFGDYPVDRRGFDGRAKALAGQETPGTLWLDAQGLAAARRAFLPGSFHVALVHGGEEWSGRPVPEQRRLYRELVRAGADLVIGSHPHVLEGMEAFDDGLIVYSLGNFLFPGMEGTNGGQDSMILKVGLVEGKVRYLQIVPVRLEGATVRLAPGGQTVERVQALSRELSSDPRGHFVGSGVFYQ